MVSRNLGICDQEERYAAALAHFFMKTKELALGVQVCNSVAQALRLQEESPIDILLIGSGYPQEERQKVRAESVFVLTQSEDVAHEMHEKLINKYQSGEAILRDVIEQCQESVEPGNFFLGTVKKEKVRIIGIFSPVHRSRKTGYALRLGKDLAKTYNVLYLNLEMYGGIGGHFPEIGQTVADALYYSRQEKKHLRAALAGMVKHMGPLDYLLPMRMSEDLKAVKIEEWMRFIEQIASQSIYEVLILDIDEGIRGVYELLRMCTEIHVAVIKEEVAQAKMFQFEEELHLMGYDDVRHKMIKKNWKDDKE